MKQLPEMTPEEQSPSSFKQSDQMCSHLRKKLFDRDGIYHPIWLALNSDPELTAAVRSRQLHIYRNGKKILILAGKSAPKILVEDHLTELLKRG